MAQGKITAKQEEILEWVKKLKSCIKNIKN